MIAIQTVETSIGVLVIGCTERGLHFIEHCRNATEAKRFLKTLGEGQNVSGESTLTRQVARDIEAYLCKKLRQWNIPLDLGHGTELQKAVWDTIYRIPYGQTISYTELAAKVKKPNAIRAAASACGKNPVPLVIPCHRVLAKDGSLGGFGWGLDIKRHLLSLECAA